MTHIILSDAARSLLLDVSDVIRETAPAKGDALREAVSGRMVASHGWRVECDRDAVIAILEGALGLTSFTDGVVRSALALPELAPVAAPRRSQVEAETVAGFWLGSAAKHVEDVVARIVPDANYVLAAHPFDLGELHAMLGRCPTWEEARALEALVRTAA